MILIFLCYILVSFVVSTRTLNLSQEQIDDLATSLDAEFPGSVDALFQWAREETVLDELEAIYTSTAPSPPQTNQHKTAMGLYILSKNPLMTEDMLDSVLRRIYGQEAVAERFAKRMIKSSQAFITVPTWYHTYWTRATLDRIPFSRAMEGLFRLISAQKSLGVVRENDIRFSMSGPPARALARIWLNFCVNVKPTEIACMHTIGAGEVTMTFETSQKALAFLAIRTMLGK